MRITTSNELRIAIETLEAILSVTKDELGTIHILKVKRGTVINDKEVRAWIRESFELVAEKIKEILYYLNKQPLVI